MMIAVALGTIISRRTDGLDSLRNVFDHAPLVFLLSNRVLPDEVAYHACKDTNNWLLEQ